MYYLNSDGTPDLTQQNTEEVYCQCDQCRRKRRKPTCYNWFSWTNITIFVVLLCIIISLTCKDTKFMNDMYNNVSAYNPLSSSSTSPQPVKIASTPPSAPINVADEFADALF